MRVRSRVPSWLRAILGRLLNGERDQLVPERGLEPPLPCENCDLNAARLPIPPFGHGLHSTLPNFFQQRIPRRGVGASENRSAATKNVHYA